MEGLYQWIVLLHVIAAFTFALAYGVSAGVALTAGRARGGVGTSAARQLKPRDDAIHGSILVLLPAGIATAFIAGPWGRRWVCAAIAVLVLIFAAMYARDLDPVRRGN